MGWVDAMWVMVSMGLSVVLARTVPPPVTFGGKVGLSAASMLVPVLTLPLMVLLAVSAIDKPADPLLGLAFPWTLALMACAPVAVLLVWALKKTHFLPWVLAVCSLPALVGVVDLTMR